MLHKRYVFIFLSFISFFLLTSCSVSEEEVQKQAEQFFQQKMEEEETKEITYEDEKVQLYVPSFTEIERLDDYNILFEREEHVFLLFVHDEMAAETETELLQQLMIEEEPFILEMGTDDGKLGYFIVVETEEDEEYVAIVGYDKFKLTTITNLSDLTDVAELMFDMVKSAATK